jgi:hypothetical protein
MPRNQRYRPAADTERGRHCGQGGCRGLTVHRTRADPHDQRAIVLAADAGTGGAGPDPDGNTHHPSVRPAPLSAASRQARHKRDATRPHLPPTARIAPSALVWEEGSTLAWCLT